MLDKGADPNARDAEGTPALMVAVLFANADSVKLLLDHHADPNATNKSGATALMWAMPDVAKARLLIAAGADVNARAKNTLRTPLLIAASYPQSMPVLQLLLDHGADIHAKDRLGVHALGRAALSADVDVVRFLVEHGCDPNEPGYGSNVRYARQYLPTLEYLLSKGVKIEKTAIASAAHWQDPKLVAEWIDRGADVNAAEGTYKRTALMTAAASEQAGAPMVKLLLEKGADPNAEDTEGERPLDWAIYRNDPDKIAVLEKVWSRARPRATAENLSAASGRRHHRSARFRGARREVAVAFGSRRVCEARLHSVSRRGDRGCGRCGGARKGRRHP